MTPSEFKIRMATIRTLEDTDKEAAHVRADELMCEVLTTLGYVEDVAVFNEMDKEYS